MSDATKSLRKESRRVAKPDRLTQPLRDFADENRAGYRDLGRDRYMKTGASRMQMTPGVAVVTCSRTMTKVPSQTAPPTAFSKMRATPATKLRKESPKPANG